LGSFKLIPQPDKIDVEIFGKKQTVLEQNFESTLKAFNPKVANGWTTTSEFKNPETVSISNGAKLSVTAIALKESYFAIPPQDTTRRIKTVIRNPKVSVNKTVTPKVSIQKKDTIPPKVDIRQPKVDVVKPKTEIKVVGGRKLDFIPFTPMTVKIIRPDDLIWLEVTFKNFKFTTKNGKTFVEPISSSKAGTVTYKFPTQHTLEEAYFEATKMDDGTDTSQPINLPARHIRAHRTRLVYTYPAGKSGFELSIHELLDWSKFTLKVHPRAYITLPTVIPDRKIVIPPLKGNQAQLIDRDVLTRNTPDNNLYRTQIVQKSKLKVQEDKVYNQNVVKAVVSTGIATTLEPNFNIASLAMSLKMEPIPDTHTSIEAPALMYISPNQVNDFTHKIDLEYTENEEKPKEVKANTQIRPLKPVRAITTPQLNLFTNKGQVTELWHTSLGIKTKNNKVSTKGLDKLKTIRALWAFDAAEDYKGCAYIDEPFQASLDANDRHKLVHTTSNYNISGFKPFPVPVRKLMLTGLGAYLDWHAFFDVPTPVDNVLNVVEWEHFATLGRDHYVKIVREGYLFPLGHRAALVKVTERKFDQGTKAAVNKMRMYVVILEPEKLYNKKDPKGAFIKFPFQAARIENKFTPNIDKPSNITLQSNTGGIRMMTMHRISDCPQKPGRSSTYNFYINVGSKPFGFDITATDKEGVEHRLNMPLAFVENITARTRNLAEKMAADYNPKTNLNKIPFNGQNVAYAESLVEGDTALETQSLAFGGQYYPSSGEGDLKFHPIMQNADVFIKQVDELTGKRQVANIKLENDENDGMVFASVTGANVDFTGGSDKSGGFASPNMSITGLSKLQGPIGGDIQDMMNLDFFPKKFFEVLGDLPMGKIFGVIDIISLLLDTPNISGEINSLVNKVKQVKESVEKIKTDMMVLAQEAKETGKDVKQQIEQKKVDLKSKVQELMDALNSQMPKIPNLKTWVTPEALYAEYKWIPEFLGKEINLFGDLLKVKVDKPKEAMSITTTMTKYLDGLSAPKLDTNATLGKFSIEIKDALVVNFNQMKFITGSTKKTDVKVDMNKSKPIEFVGALSFVNNLQSLIPSTGFSEDGPYINLTMQGVKAGFNISVPDVEVGVFSLTNMTLGAYVDLPFTGGELTMGFNFCSRENPFLLTVSGFGGGGYFLMITTLKGLKSVEAAFEFGASASLSLGVASGGVTIMGGFYFKYEVAASGDEELNLTGYIRINGRMSVLGLISVSIEFYLSLEAAYVTKQIGNGQTVKKVEKMQGVAKLKVKVEVLFFSKTVTITVKREFAGADADPTFAQMVLPEDWNEYCLAFA
jgi:gas vesicle protein